GGYRTGPGRRPRPRAVREARLKRLDGPVHEARQPTINAVARSGHEAVPATAQHLKGRLSGEVGKPAKVEEPVLISEALEGLTRLVPDAPELPAMLARSLEDAKPEVRRQAASLLGQLGPRAA